MGINPFKDANLADLQKSVLSLLKDMFGNMLESIKFFFRRINKKGNERITLMFIPHSEKKIINFHISIYAISLFLIIIVITVSVTSILIVNHASTVKQVSQLKSHDVDSGEQLEIFKIEITKLSNLFESKLKKDFEGIYSTIYGRKNSDNLWAVGGNDLDVAVEGFSSDNLTPNKEILILEGVENDLKIMKEHLQKIKSNLNSRKKIIENTPSIWPASGYVISSFGRRKSPLSFQNEFVQGIDIASFPGAEIRATAPGTVESIVWSDTYGLRITLKHKYGFSTIYSHCQRISVKKGQKISKGEVIGFVGRTGKATRHICHYQIKIGTEFVDPLPYLNKITPEIDQNKSSEE